MNRLSFNNPEYLWLLLLIPAIAAWYWYRLRFRSAALQLSTTRAVSQLSPGWKQYARHGLFALRLLALTFLILAFSRPQRNLNRQDISVEGIDIMLTTDVSRTMLAEDLHPNRLEAAKKVAIDFISSRPDDRIGLVIFSGESFTQCPLTTNHATLINLFRSVGFGLINDGTAIGDGLATAINRLKESKSASKVIILLTDGDNNMGSIDPLSASEIATLYGIRIYTIGVGTEGLAPFPVQTPFGVEYQQQEVKLNEDLLKKIAATTHGKYFRAVNNEKLESIYHEIDQLERSRIDVTEFSRKKEEFMPFVLLALALLAAEFALRFVFLKIIN